MSRRFPCISCLEPLAESFRWALILASGLWWKKLTPTGSWCEGCATASEMKRNIRLRNLQRARKKERK